MKQRLGSAHEGIDIDPDTSSEEFRQLASQPYRDKQIQPIWLQIYERLGSAIAAGLLPEGRRLPSEDALAAVFGVTRRTLRRALNRHQQEGRLLSRKGVGVFVRSLAVRYVVHQHEAFNASLDDRSLRNETLSLGRRPASALAAKIFGLAAGEEVIELRMLSIVDTAPIYLAIKEFPIAIFPDFEAAYLQSGTILGAYASGGVNDYNRVQTRLFGDTVTKEEAALLQLNPGAPLIRSHAFNTDPSGRTIEVNRGCWPMFSVELVFGDAHAFPALEGGSF